jgi:Cu2+-containing amine oxidase
MPDFYLRRRTRTRAVMPTHWFGFRLMPHNFFATNAAMTIWDVK